MSKLITFLASLTLVAIAAIFIVFGILVGAGLVVIFG